MTALLSSTTTPLHHYEGLNFRHPRTLQFAILEIDDPPSSSGRGTLCATAHHGLQLDPLPRPVVEEPQNILGDKRPAIPSSERHKRINRLHAGNHGRLLPNCDVQLQQLS